jgi:hypothetical protein
MTGDAGSSRDRDVDRDHVERFGATHDVGGRPMSNP